MKTVIIHRRIHLTSTAHVIRFFKCCNMRRCNKVLHKSDDIDSICHRIRRSVGHTTQDDATGHHANSSAWPKHIPYGMFENESTTTRRKTAESQIATRRGRRSSNARNQEQYNKKQNSKMQIHKPCGSSPSIRQAK